MDAVVEIHDSAVGLFPVTSLSVVRTEKHHLSPVTSPPCVKTEQHKRTFSVHGRVVGPQPTPLALLLTPVALK